MTCKYCGAQFPVGAAKGRKCPQCQRIIITPNDMPPARRGTSARRRRRTSRAPILIGVGVVTALAIGIALFAILFFGDGPQSPDYAGVLDKYFLAIQNRDAAGLAQTRPDAYVAYLTGQGGGYADYAAYIDSWAQIIEQRMNGYVAALGTNIRIDYTIDRATDVGAHLQTICQALTSRYGFADDSASAALVVSGYYVVTGSSGSQRNEIADTLLIRIGNIWYFAPDVGAPWEN